MALIKDFDFEVVGEESHECEICQMLMKNAVELECTHTFCEQCLKTWQNQAQARDGNSFRCPSCNNLYQQHQVHKSGYLDRIIRARILVKCKRHTDCCTWIGTISDYFQIHESRCDFRVVKCAYCCKEYIFNKLTEHKKECLVGCPNPGCGTLLKRDEIQSHKEIECLHETIQCSHSIYGCDVRMKRGMLDEHHRSSWKHHLNLFNCRHKNLQEQLENEQKRNKKHLQDMEILKQQNEAFLKEIRKHDPGFLSDDEKTKDWTFEELDNLLRINNKKFKAIVNLKPELLQLRSQLNETLLISASGHETTESVETLINMGYNVREKTKDGWIAIHDAAHFDHTKTVEILLEHDPTLINAKTCGDWTPLHCAAYSDSLQTVELLLQHPLVDINIKNCEGNTADKCSPCISDNISRMIRTHSNSTFIF